ncbi:MAG: DUF2264 domain-containing protein [Caldilinea sp.]
MTKPGNHRLIWIDALERIARPVLTAGAAGELRQRMPVEAAAGTETDRAEYTHLEAVGRLLCGIAPWLEVQGLDGAEARLRAELAAMARATLAHGVDPASPDFLNFNRGAQPIVDAAFLAQALLRAPRTLWSELDNATKRNVCDALAATRTRKPHFNNWLLFAATIEAFLARAGVFWDAMRVDYALRQHMEWYLGDGMYGDGPEFHWDYYNGFVIQPMLVDVLAAVGDEDPAWGEMRTPVLARAQRYATIQERLISPEGTFPPIGRSLAYRFGAFQTLAQMALLDRLPAEISPAQVRCALTAVIQRMIDAPGAFDAAGWLRIGFAGHQPGLGERYISTGSLYLCAAGLLPLGLSPDHPFWRAAPQPWTAQRLWSGEDMPCDHAL